MRTTRRIERQTIVGHLGWDLMREVKDGMVETVVAGEQKTLLDLSSKKLFFQLASLNNNNINYINYNKQYWHFKTYLILWSGP